MVACVGPNHNIISLKTEEAYDPVSRYVIATRKVLCSRCGQSVEEIRGPQKKTRRSKKQMAAENSPGVPEVPAKLANLD